ncbi:hypothetical protein BDZ91DRAFT_713356, partial [Kalaharituber pfeilii]
MGLASVGSIQFGCPTSYCTPSSSLLFPQKPFLRWTFQEESVFPSFAFNINVYVSVSCRRFAPSFLLDLG